MMNTAFIELAANKHRDEMNFRALSLLAYWYSACGDRSVPDRHAFDPIALRDWLGFISIYEHAPTLSDFTNRLEGTLISDMTGQDWTGQKASDVDRSFGSKFGDELSEVLETCTPSIDIVPIFQKRYRTATKILMPVAGKGNDKASQVFLAMFPNW
ncbi:PAS domain-containing protein [Nisaea acidiphila]|uniref:PAS domain-containing protein n=1 Tax=Nisaea acidiphila TaxID=1862145 RepID=A0A9J7AYP1_9PROT|nr:PAS domain-containing protein [Nisaea acidiphila]UUX51388.1 PAS domain-containing protein [Nisaea acidiphila]